MSVAELAAAAAAREEATNTELPGTPTMDDGGGFSPAADYAAPVPSIADLLHYFGQQNARMENIMALMQHDHQMKKEPSFQRPLGGEILSQRFNVQ